MAILQCMGCGGKVKTRKDEYTATCEYCGNEMTVFESTAEFEVDSKGVLVQYNGKGGDVEIPDNIRKIGPEAFRDNQRIFTVTIPDTILEIGANAFRDCGELEEINLPNSLEILGAEAFRGCNSLREITIPNGVLSIPVGLFIECYNLETVRLHDSIRNIEKSGFLECKRLKNIRLPEKLRRLGDYAFDECCSLSELELPETLQVIGKQAFYMCTSLKKVRIPDAVHTMGGWAFEGCTGLTEVSIGSGLTELPNGTFKGCASLTEINVPGNICRLNMSVFDGCTGLKTLHLNEGLQEIHGHALCGANSLEGTLNIPSTLPALGLFNVTTKIKHLVIGKAVENIKYTNSTFPALETVTVLEGTTALGNYAFRYCKNLKTVSLPSTLQTIGAEAFEECDSLETVHIPCNVTAIGTRTFAKSGIMNVVFDSPEQTRLEEIPKEAFLYCDHLKSISLPGSIRSIADEAFLGCRSLTTVRIAEGCKVIGVDAFCSTECGARTFHLPGTIQAIGKDAFYSFRPTELRSPQNSTIQNYCNSHSDCRWVHQPSRAEMEQQLAQQRQAERKKTIEKKQTAYSIEKQKEGQLRWRLTNSENELKTVNQRIAVLEDQLPALTGVFKKGKRQKCEEELSKAQRTRDSLVRNIEETNHELQSCLRLQQSTLEEIKKLKN